MRKQWPFRVDLQTSREVQRIYFDTKPKLDKWLAALDWILEQGETTQSEASPKHHNKHKVNSGQNNKRDEDLLKLPTTRESKP